MNPLVSIIVPVYMTEQYIRDCLDSIENQTYRNIEVIIVDDGTTDNSMAIAQEYVALDSRFRIVTHSKNLGLFQARITGVLNSNGDYIMFVDSDDTISCDWVRMLVTHCEETDSDVTFGDFVLGYSNGSKFYHSFDPIYNSSFTLSGPDFFRLFMKQRGLFYGFHTIWNKIYRRTLWDACIEKFIRFSESVGKLVMTEDLAFSSILFITAKQVSNVHDVYYTYRQSDDSATGLNISSKKFSDNLKNVKSVFTLFKNTLCDHGLYKEYESDYQEWVSLYGRIYSNNLKQLKFSALQKSHAISEISDLFGADNCNGYRIGDLYFYSEFTEFSSDSAILEQIKLKISEPSITLVSFDVFDTLVLRPFFYPTDLFYQLNDRFAEITHCSSYVDFREIRIDAERQLRENLRNSYSKREDITIDEIYQYIHENYSFDEECLDKLKENEKELEIQFSYIRRTGKQLYDLAHSLNKKVIFTSDMYLDHSTVSAILEKSGYVSDNLYLSSDIMLTKNTGNLYDYVILDNGLKSPGSMFHIGDNYHSDFEVPKSKGICSFHMPRTIDVLTYTKGGSSPAANLYNLLRYPDTAYYDGARASDDFWGIRSAWAVVANKIFDNPFVSFKKDTAFNQNPYYLGYCALGMHMMGIVKWLMVNETDPETTIHFVARDGYVPKLAYDLLATENNPKSDYMPVSRKALLTVDMSCPSDLYSIPSKMNILESTPKKLITLLMPLFSDESYAVVEKKVCSGFSSDSKFKSPSEFRSFIKKLISDYGNLMDFTTNKQRLCEILSRTVKQGDVIFDVGYSGRTESSLSNVLGFPVSSYYIHINTDVALARSKHYGFLIHTFYDYKPAVTGTLREHLMMKMAPSVCGYIIKDSTLVPIYDKYDIDFASYIQTKIIQSAALDFIKDMKALFHSPEKLPFRRLDISMPFEYYLHSSKCEDRKIFNCLLFEDDFSVGEEFNIVNFWSNDIDRLAKMRASCDNRNGYVQEDGICGIPFYDISSGIKKVGKFMVDLYKKIRGI